MIEFYKEWIKPIIRFFFSVVLPIILIILMLSTWFDCKCQPRHIEFGASVGFPANTKSYDGVVEWGVRYGLKHFRFYDPFVAGYDTNVSKIADLVYYYTIKKGASSVLISVSNNAFSQLKYDTVGLKLSKQQLKTIAYTNRCFPKDTVYFINLLKKLGNELKNRNLLSKVEFELTDETDAANFFFGTFDEAKKLMVIKCNALKEFNRPMIVGSFTSSLMSDTSYKSRGHWYNYIMTDTILNSNGFSHSFYWTDSRSTGKDTISYFNLYDNDYPTRGMNYTYITEYNMYTSISNGLRDSTMNSVQYMRKLAQLLTWIYYKPQIKRIYFHPLCEVNNGTVGKMGLWEKRAHMNYLPKASAKYVQDMINVVKDDYTLLPNGGLKGKYYSLIFNSVGYQIINN